MTIARPTARTGSLFALGCLGILGALPVLAEGRPAGFDALAFAFFLSVWQSVCGLPLFVWSLRRSGPGIPTAASGRPPGRRTLAVALTTGLLFGLSTYLYVLAVERNGAVNAAVAIQAYPLFAILWESLFLGKRKSAAELALTGVMIVALVGLATGGTYRLGGLSPWFLAALAVPLLWSIAHVMIRLELARLPVTPEQVTFARVFLSALFLGLVLALVDPGAFAFVSNRSFQAAALAMGAAYYLELVLWFHALRHIEVSLASSIVTPWPAVTMALAALFLGQTVTAFQIIAFLVVAGCIYGLILLEAHGRQRRAQAA